MVGSPPIIFPSEGGMVITKIFYYHTIFFKFLVKTRMVISLLYFLKKNSMDFQNDYQNDNMKFFNIFSNYHKYEKMT